MTVVIGMSFWDLGVASKLLDNESSCDKWTKQPGDIEVTWSYLSLWLPLCQPNRCPVNAPVEAGLS